VTVDAYRERYRYARDRTALLCWGLCRRHRPRAEFRETPNHGRAAACLDCEPRGFVRGHTDRFAWLLEQEREKNRTLTKHLARVKAQRDRMARVMTSGDILTYRELDVTEALHRRQEQIGPYIAAIASALEDMLPGDAWHTAHAIKQLASGEIDGETAMKEAFPHE
jgi:hypothetical protein